MGFMNKVYINSSHAFDIGDPPEVKSLFFCAVNEVIFWHKERHHPIKTFWHKLILVIFFYLLLQISCRYCLIAAAAHHMSANLTAASVRPRNVQRPSPKLSLTQHCANFNMMESFYCNRRSPIISPSYRACT